MTTRTKPPRRKFTLRIPEPLARKLEERAEQAGHSMNAEAIAALRRHIDGVYASEDGG